jgi:hypothetical protein
LCRPRRLSRQQPPECIVSVSRASSRISRARGNIPNTLDLTVVADGVAGGAIGRVLLIVVVQSEKGRGTVGIAETREFGRLRRISGRRHNAITVGSTERTACRIVLGARERKVRARSRATVRGGGSVQ